MFVYININIYMFKCNTRRRGMQPKSYPDVSIVIMDLKGFTHMSSTMAAQDLVRFNTEPPLNPEP